MSNIKNYLNSQNSIFIKMTLAFILLLIFVSASCQDHQDTLVYVTVEDYENLSKLQFNTVRERDSLQNLLDFHRSFEMVLNIPDSIRADTFHTTIYNDDISIYVNVFNDRGLVRITDENLRFYLDYTSAKKWNFFILDSTKTIFNPMLNLEELIDY